ncbi:MAG: hypothetical protein WC819_02120 [Parcubacteria group bacterium]|jgi:ElaB/YqjD/DUF883 family membrane-anchored ribosome-binding protein
MAQKVAKKKVDPRALAKKEAQKLQMMAEKEMKKVKKELVAAEKKVADFIKKNPAKAAAISAGAGAVIGASIAALLTGRKK